MAVQAAGVRPLRVRPLRVRQAAEAEVAVVAAHHLRVLRVTEVTAVARLDRVFLLAVDRVVVTVDRVVALLVVSDRQGRRAHPAIRLGRLQDLAPWILMTHEAL